MGNELTGDDAAMLARDPLFAGLSDKQLKAVRGVAKVFTFSPGQELTAEGERAGRFYLITQGSAAVVVQGEERAVLSAGTSFGEVSLIDGGPRTATVVATTDVRTISLAGFNFRPLLREHPELADAVMHRLCALLRLERTLPATMPPG